MAITNTEPVTTPAGNPYRHFEVELLTPAIGAEIRGVDLSADLDEEVVSEIRRALLEHLVVFFRDQPLTPEAQLAFARRFGALARYPLVEGMEGYPDIVEVIKNEDERHNFGGMWHTDTIYLDRPPLGSVLYSVQIPPVGGDTLFANQYLAFESLSEGMQHMLSGLRAVHSNVKADAAVGRAQRALDRPGERAGTDLVSEHPVVRTHPETGRRALYLSSGHTECFLDMSASESRGLLEYLFAHQVRPEFCCRFRWTEGVVALWDNRAAQHNALNDYHGYRRVMRRVTLEGDQPA